MHGTRNTSFLPKYITLIGQKGEEERTVELKESNGKTSDEK